ncbi:MAG TPA: NAD(P)-dependent oxidoreductase, partial [Tetragenococcus sp.]|nr:NAD(P)-dependent oxidoreductase [Tetragenococcus sp.]
MYHILTMGELSERLQRRINRRERFEFSSQYSDPEAIFVRSALVSDELIKERLLVIGRAGSGVNTINVKACSQNGTMVFNTPGVNANAVKELVLTSLLNSVRPVEQAAAAVQTLRGADILEKSEKLRNHFVGGELEGKTVGILGLGAIGELVAKACYQLGMDVIGYARQPRQEDYFEQVYDLK